MLSMQLRPASQSAVLVQDCPTLLNTCAGLVSSSPQPTSRARAMLVAPIKDITRELRICSSDYCHDPGALFRSRSANERRDQSTPRDLAEPWGSAVHFVINLNSIRRFC